MKKIISLLLIFGVCGLSNCQIIVTTKLEKETLIKENLKKIIPKNDSIKTDKSVAGMEQIVDSVAVPKGKFRPFKVDAHASYYADKFTGRKTASGKIFNNNALTCAHKNLPFGTKLKVTNKKNGKTVFVEVTDRGPFVKGRELDLTKRAFMNITSNKGGGAVIVTIEIIQKM